MELHDSPFAELTTRTFHDILRLRIDIFVVEQDCPYPELDGLDILSTTRHVYLQDDRDVVAYVRLLTEPDAIRIGRVVTRIDRRGEGLSGHLLGHALAASEGPWILHAQAHLADWYGRYGFLAEGHEFLEDGIPHVFMRKQI